MSGEGAMHLGVDFGLREAKEGGGGEWDGCELLFVFHGNNQ